MNNDMVFVVKVASILDDWHLCLNFFFGWILFVK